MLFAFSYSQISIAESDEKMEIEFFEPTGIVNDLTQKNLNKKFFVDSPIDKMLLSSLVSKKKKRENWTQKRSRTVKIDDSSLQEMKDYIDDLIATKGEVSGLHYLSDNDEFSSHEYVYARDSTKHIAPFNMNFFDDDAGLTMFLGRAGLIERGGVVYRELSLYRKPLEFPRVGIHFDEKVTVYFEDDEARFYLKSQDNVWVRETQKGSGIYLVDEMREGVSGTENSNHGSY
jgi:hypothetical protein